MPDPAIIVVARSEFLQQHPDAVKKFTQGHRDSIKFVEQDKKQAADILAKAFNVPQITAKDKTWTSAEVVEKALNRHQFDDKFTEKDFQFYQTIADVNYKLKLIDKPFDVTTPHG